MHTSNAGYSAEKLLLVCYMLGKVCVCYSCVFWEFGHALALKPGAAQLWLSVVAEEACPRDSE